MKKEFYELYDMMAMSHDVENMRTFGNVHKEMMEWMIQNKPDLAQEWIGKLESIKWCNYLTPKEAEKIVSEMVPKGFPRLLGVVRRGRMPCSRSACRWRKSRITIRALCGPR